MKKKIIICILLILIFCLFYFGTKYEIPFLFCPIEKFFHVYCPGCGVTRMIISMIEGNFYQAFRYNSFMFVFSPFFLLCGIDEISTTFFKTKGIFVKKIDNKFWIFLLFFAVVFGVLRNLPWFDFLAPITLN